MPYIQKSTYKKPSCLLGRHVETIFPSVFRKVNLPEYCRERIYTEDHDFLDLDWLHKNKERLVILSHGLEGASDRPYMKGMAKAFYEKGWSVLAWNCRSCSGEMNSTYRLYHHGATYDLKAVVQHALKKYAFEKVVLIGFSMGGSLTVKYLGETPGELPQEVKGGVAFSVPFRLDDSARKLSDWENTIYRKRFLRKLLHKIKLKSSEFPELYSLDGIESVRDFSALDKKYLAAISGFASATEFYEHASAGNFISALDRPVLVVNAANDPMLPPSCYPISAASDHEYFYLEIPRKGGHVGFSTSQGDSWMEKRALQFTYETILNEKDE